MRALSDGQVLVSVSRWLPTGRAEMQGDIIMSRRWLLTSGGAAMLGAAAVGAAEPPMTATKRTNGTMEIKRNGSQPSNKGSMDYFTRAVPVDPLFPVREPGRVSAHRVPV